MKSSKKFWIGVIILLAIIYLWIAFDFHIRITGSSDLPHGIYRVVHSKPELGDLVEICLSPDVAQYALKFQYIHQGDCPHGGAPIIKSIVATAGDNIILEKDQVIINGKVLPYSAQQESDHRGWPLKHVNYGHYILHANQYWVMGHERHFSWDSRYFGVINADNIVGVIKPVLTF